MKIFKYYMAILVFAIILFSALIKGQVYVPIHQEEEIYGGEGVFYPQFQTHWLDVPITKRMVLDYAEECYNDTLKAKLFEQDYTSEQQYIVEMDGINWMASVKQLEDEGYFYQYRWIINTVIDENNPMEFEYIFVKEPTMKGFIEWLKEEK